MRSNTSLLRTLYSNTSGKYLKLRTRLKKARQSGRFYTLSKRKQHTLIQRIRKLLEQLKSLQAQLRLSGIAAAFALTMGATGADAQSTLGPFVREDAKNPLPPPVRIALPKPASVDIDSDGDFDVFVGDKYGDVHFFRNTAGKDVVRRLTREEDNLLGGRNFGNLASPAFIDVDADGDFDLLIGNNEGSTYFFRNTGTASSPQFEEQIGASNPFDGIQGSTTPDGTVGPALPAFADIDNDSDLDLVVGSSYLYDNKYSYASAIQVFINTAGTFNQSNSGIFGDLNYGSRRSLTFVDLDNDGDADLLAGAENGQIRAFLNDGSSFTEQYGAWNPTTHTGNPMAGTYLSGNVWMNLADLDHDGDLDMFVGNGNNYSTSENSNPISFFENTGEFVFEQRDGLNISPFDGVDVNRRATPAFVDIDDDGDLDAVLGGKYTLQVNLYRNTDGFLLEDKDDQISSLNLYDNLQPVFVDIDGDGDQDMFVTGGYGSEFFENTDNTFTKTSSPIDLNSFDRPSVAFIDVDADDDLDALVFNRESSEIEFSRNTGDAQAPSFQPQSAPEPFNSVTFDISAKLNAVDIDHDGDLDLIVSESVYNLGYFTSFRVFDNLGNGTFDELTPAPFDEFASIYSIMNMSDVDLDGDLDILVGYGDNHSGVDGGTVAFFENQNVAPVTEVTKSVVRVAYNTPVTLDPDLTIFDSDGDEIVQATVTISNYAAGNEVLSFTPSAGVIGSFQSGELTITGKATLETYETILRSVTYEATGDVTASLVAARGIPPSDKVVTFSVRDIDFTRTIVSVVSVISLDITGEATGVVVFNAISPGEKDDKNDYVRIEGLPAKNKVTILNRWGDKVFEVSDYNNDTRRFEGKSDSGKDLPAGTYYYVIDTSDKKYSGYISLKR